MPPLAPHANPAHHTKTTRTTRGTGRFMSVSEFCDELGIARSTFYDWRAKNTAPSCMKLPNGELRIRRADFDAWLESLPKDVA